MAYKYFVNNTPVKKRVLLLYDPHNNDINDTNNKTWGINVR
jgi:hypothetical protein